jgi:nucleolar complex protein 2
MPGKRSIRFLRKAAKSDTGVKSMGRKRRRSIEPEMDEVELDDHAISMNEIKDMNETNNTTPSSSSSHKKHKDELADLRQKDPEFFEYLQKHDANLLDFEDDLEDDEFNELENLEEEEALMNNGSDDDEEEEPDFGSKSKRKSPKLLIEATEELVKELVSSSTNGSVTALKKILTIFRITCLPNADRQGTEEWEQTSNYVITNPEVYEFVMVEVLENLQKSFYHQLDLSLSRPLTRDDLTNLEAHPKWKRMQMAILSFYKSILHILVTLSSQIYSKPENADTSKGEKTKDSNNKKKTVVSPASASSSHDDGSCHVASFILSCLEPYIALLSPLPRLAKGVMKVFLSIWSNGPLPEQDTHNVRGYCFLRLRQMVLILPEMLTEECFRITYLTFARTVKSYSEYSASSVVFMSQCVSELYHLNIAHAYQQTFLSIRQLSLHLRTAILKKSTEAVKHVLTWQYLNCIRLWTRVLCSLPSEDDLGPLIYPLIQIIQGVITISPSALYLPYHLHLISCMQQLAAYSKHFIPTASYLLHYLDLHEISQSPPTPSTDTPPKLQYLIKLSSTSITKVPVRDLLVQNIFNMLRYDTEIYRYHVGLPEYLFLTIKKLKLFLKKIKVNRWKDLLRALVHHMEQCSTWVKTNRVKLGLTPLEINEFEALKGYCVGSSGGFEVCEKRLVKLMTVDQGSVLTDSGRKEDGVIIVPGGFHGVQSPGNGQIRAVTVLAQKQLAKKKKTKGGDDSDDDSESNSDSDRDEEENSEEEEKVIEKPSKKAQKKKGGKSNKKKAALSEVSGDVSVMRDEIGNLDWSDEEA